MPILLEIEGEHKPVKAYDVMRDIFSDGEDVGILITETAVKINSAEFSEEVSPGRWISVVRKIVFR